jgi:hypothetical protein
METSKDSGLIDGDGADDRYRCDIDRAGSKTI